jgi:hypothetical protein
MYNFNENIQRGILYLLKNDTDFFLQIINLVKPEYFEYPMHSKIYSCVKEYYEKYYELPTDDFIIEVAKKKLQPRELISDYQDELSYVNNLDTSSISSKTLLRRKL